MDEIVNNPSKPQGILFLLCDPDPILVRVISNKFKKDAGWDSVIASDYNEAIAAFERNNPNAIVTEIMINDASGKTGLDLIAEVQGKEHGKEAHIIIFTELSQDDDRARAEQLGVKNYFVKTQITVNEFIRELQQIVA